jgi:hypothetical protein
LSVENPLTGIKKTRRVSLIDKDGNAVQTAAQAVAELKRLQIQRSDNALPTLTRTPKFSDYVAHYLDFIGSGQRAKKPGTVEKEKTILNRWIEFLGSLRLDQIKPVHVNRFIFPVFPLCPEHFGGQGGGNLLSFAVVAGILRRLNL